MKQTGELEFECTGLEAGGRFAPENTGYGEDLSPGFVIGNLPAEAKSFMVTLEDLDHPIKGFTHWVIWNIPAADTIPRGIPHGKRVESLGGAVQGAAYGLHRYAGPKPPRGKSHRYRFTVYALDCMLRISAFSAKKKVLRNAQGHIIRRGELCGHYE